MTFIANSTLATLFYTLLKNMNGGVMCYILSLERVDRKAESGVRMEKTEFSSLGIQHASGPSPLLTEGQADLLKILLSSALKTDSAFLFMQIFYHARCSIAHI